MSGEGAAALVYGGFGGVVVTYVVVDMVSQAP